MPCASAAKRPAQQDNDHTHKESRRSVNVRSSSRQSLLQPPQSLASRNSHNNAPPVLHHDPLRTDSKRLPLDYTSSRDGLHHPIPTSTSNPPNIRTQHVRSRTETMGKRLSVNPTNLAHYGNTLTQKPPKSTHTTSIAERAERAERASRPATSTISKNRDVNKEARLRLLKVRQEFAEQNRHAVKARLAKAGKPAATRIDSSRIGTPQPRLGTPNSTTVDDAVYIPIPDSDRDRILSKESQCPRPYGSSCNESPGEPVVSIDPVNRYSCTEPSFSTLPSHASASFNITSTIPESESIESSVKLEVAHPAPDHLQSDRYDEPSYNNTVVDIPDNNSTSGPLNGANLYTDPPMSRTPSLQGGGRYSFGVPQGMDEEFHSPKQLATVARPNTSDGKESTYHDARSTLPSRVYAVVSNQSKRGRSSGRRSQGLSVVRRSMRSLSRGRDDTVLATDPSIENLLKKISATTDEPIYMCSTIAQQANQNGEMMATKDTGNVYRCSLNDCKPINGVENVKAVDGPSFEESTAYDEPTAYDSTVDSLAVNDSMVNNLTVEKPTMEGLPSYNRMLHNPALPELHNTTLDECHIVRETPKELNKDQLLAFTNTEDPVPSACAWMWSSPQNALRGQMSTEQQSELLNPSAQQDSSDEGWVLRDNKVKGGDAAEASNLKWNDPTESEEVAVKSIKNTDVDCAITPAKAMKEMLMKMRIESPSVTRSHGFSLLGSHVPRSPNGGGLSTLKRASFRSHTDCDQNEQPSCDSWIRAGTAHPSRRASIEQKAPSPFYLASPLRKSFPKRKSEVVPQSDSTRPPGILKSQNLGEISVNDADLNHTALSEGKGVETETTSAKLKALMGKGIADATTEELLHRLAEHSRKARADTVQDENSLDARVRRLMSGDGLEILSPTPKGLQQLSKRKSLNSIRGNASSGITSGIQ